ncbi:MAG: N-acetylmuramoyl-L-alanine amidase [Alphaproteobacteria bacterium]|nr:MAG: N-acetylmuramoyl-L-alanine amidase [Alphaproteobacteria bacterium]
MELLLAIIAIVLALTGGDSSRAAPDDPGTVTISLDRPGGGPRPDDPKIYGARNPDRPLVILDAGHGGRDPEATSPIDGSREKDVTLAVARAIRDELVASGRVRVAMTREDDRFLVLQDRYQIARRLGADLFISVHADAAPANDGARGATIYTLSEVASDKEAALLAQQQNSADRLAGAPLADDAGVNRILIGEGSAFFPFRPDYHRFASLIVLKAPDVPSLLFETGYLTNSVDSTYIHSPEGQKQIALGMRRAIEAHFARRLLERRR